MSLGLDPGSSPAAQPGHPGKPAFSLLSKAAVSLVIWKDGCENL